jgi:hypothetical protein
VALILEDLGSMVALHSLLPVTANGNDLKKGPGAPRLSA